MASGRWITRRAEGMRALLAGVLAAAGLVFSASGQAASCDKPLYFTFDTGHMEIAPLVAEVLKRQDVKVTFFAANEPTKEGDGSLGDHWAAWWRARAGEGHAFASHTYDHVYWRGDLPAAADGMPRFKVRASAGPATGQDRTMDARQYCEEIGRSSARLQAITGQRPLPLFRAPGGKTSPQLLAAARSCGYAHASWAPAGFLGDELPSDKYPNAQLQAQALRNIKTGDILLAHLGIWSRKDAWAPAVLEPLIVGLKSRGFCFATLRDHPDFKQWIATHDNEPWKR